MRTRLIVLLFIGHTRFCIYQVHTQHSPCTPSASTPSPHTSHTPSQHTPSSRPAHATRTQPKHVPPPALMSAPKRTTPSQREFLARKDDFHRRVGAPDQKISAPISGRAQKEVVQILPSPKTPTSHPNMMSTSSTSMGAPKTRIQRDFGWCKNQINEFNDCWQKNKNSTNSTIFYDPLSLLEIVVAPMFRPSQNCVTRQTNISVSSRHT